MGFLKPLLLELAPKAISYLADKASEFIKDKKEDLDRRPAKSMISTSQNLKLNKYEHLDQAPGRVSLGLKGSAMLKKDSGP